MTVYRKHKPTRQPSENNKRIGYQQYQKGDNGESFENP